MKNIKITSYDKKSNSITNIYEYNYEKTKSGYLRKKICQAIDIELNKGNSIYLHIIKEKGL